MIDDSIGIRMCRNKKVRKDLGTITYKETKIVLSDPKIHYDEIHNLIKKEKKKQQKNKLESKKIDIKKMTKEEQIEKLVDLQPDDFTQDESNSDNDLLFMDEPIEIKSGTNELDEEGKELEKEVNKIKITEKEQEENPVQEGGLRTKKIYVTDLSVEKDKEMFQM